MNPKVGLSVIYQNNLLIRLLFMSEFLDIIQSEKPILVDFFATWCGPCKVQAPIIEQVKNKVGDKATIVKIDIDRNPKLANKYRVQSVPTLIIFKKGRAEWRAVGVQSEDTLVNKINEFVADSSL